ncbi:efflux RND transporter periplasmic adaptor subunit [Tepidimonas sediminis]|nr:efflux RND transporter periplasmic adaptor subunit [Tepidimonas sediminis]
MERRTLWIAGGAMALAGLAAAAWLMARPAPVRVVTVQRAPIVQAVVVSGRVEASARLDVGAELTATVREVLVREGDAVRAGQTLIRLADDEALAALRQAEATLQEARLRRREQADVTAPVSEQTLAQAEANLRNAEREAERARALVARGFYPTQRADEAERALAQARGAAQAARVQAQANRAGEVAAALAAARERQAEAAVALAQARLARLRLTSPAAGVVLARHVEPGGLAQPGRALLTLAVDGPLRIEAAVDEKHVRQLAPGMRARAAADADPAQPFDAVLEWIAPAADAQRGTVAVRLALPDPPPWLRPEMAVSVEIVGARREDALVVPAVAVRDPDGPAPWVLALRDGRAVRVPVTLGLRGVGHVELASGVEAGAALIPQTEKAAAGDRVRALPAAGARGPDIPQGVLSR